MSFRSYRTQSIVPVLVIIILCFLVYIGTEVARVMGHDWVPILGLQPISFLQQPWTMITDLFMHDPSSIWHILFNMITLYFFGTFLLRLVGTRDFFIIYFVGGIIGNIFFMLFAFMNFFTSPYSIVIGASGAIFALGGTLAILTPRLRVFVFPIPVAMPLWVAVIGGFVILSFLGGVAWQGHLGGLVTGLVAGLLLRRQIRTPYS
jgi:membrane associated rhomboid family serine protease